MMLLLLALARFLIHLLSTGLSDQGYHRVELYLQACGERLSAGYLEFPPLSPWLARVAGTLSGHELLLFRAVPALAGALSVLMAGVIARQLGGGRFAQLLAALALMFAPGSLLQGSLLCLGVFDTLLFSVAVSALLFAVERERRRWWLLFGLALGLLLLNHFTNLIPVLVLLIALPVSSARTHLKSRHFVLGCLFGLLVLLPNLLWQFRHDFPSLAYFRAASMSGRIEVPVSAFLLALTYVLHPLLLPLWFAGLCWLLFNGRGGARRALGWVFLLTSAALIVTQSTRPIRLVLLAPLLFAAGAVALETASRSRLLRVASILVVTVGGLVTLPLAVPGLSPERARQYAESLRMPPVAVQHLFDRVGWREMAENVAKVCRTLTAEEREKSVILAGNYGEAAALELFLADQDPPPVLCGHNEYHVFSAAVLARDGSPETAIAIGWPPFHLHALFEQVQQVGAHRMPEAMPGERFLPIFLCRLPKTPLSTYWERVQTDFDDDRVD